MRTQVWLWGAAAAYYVALVIIYAAVGGEAAGIAMVAIAAVFGGFVAGWWWRETRGLDEQAQDLPDADTQDAIGDVGVYPTASLRPVAVAVGMTATVLGVVLGSWMVIGGLAIVGSQVALLVRDLDR